MRLTVLILMVLFIPPSVPSKVMTAIEMTSSILELVTGVGEVWDIINGFVQIVDKPPTEQEKMVLEKLDMINVKLDEIGDNVNSLVKEVNMISHLVKLLPDLIQTELDLHDIQNYQILINRQFTKMKKYVTDRVKYENITLLDFSDAVTSNQANSVSTMIATIAAIVSDTDFLQKLQQKLHQPQTSSFCQGQQSPQQIYHSMLTEMLLTNTKSYLTIQAAYVFKKLLMQGNFSKEIEDATQDFKQRTDDFLRLFSSYMSSLSAELWRCDPEEHVQNETYLEVTSLLQGIILNDMNLNAAGDCHEGCKEAQYTKRYPCHVDDWCRFQPKPNCPKVINCRFVADKMTVCKADSNSTGKRYEYIEFEGGTTYGNKENCPKKLLTELHTYKNDLFWDCSYCFCLCDEGYGTHSDRSINLRPVIANIKKNRVVTGLRFVKLNQIIHLQIQEGELLPQGQIDLSTLRWVPPENYKLMDEYIIEKVDYHTFTSEERAIDLVTVKVDEDFLVTGVRFRVEDGQVDLDILVTRFNFTTGKLFRREIFYKSSPNGHSVRHKLGKELKLSKPDIPTRSNFPSIPDESRANYVKLVNSDMKKDAAQSTVPFFDAQPVGSLVPSPLSGVGIYHKGRDGSGGFIAPKIIPYDFSRHLKPVFQTTPRKKRSVL